jgi:hypothetical protein
MPFTGTYAFHFNLATDHEVSGVEFLQEHMKQLGIYSTAFYFILLCSNLLLRTHLNSSNTQHTRPRFSTAKENWGGGMMIQMMLHLCAKISILPSLVFQRHPVSITSVTLIFNNALSY